MKPLINVIDNFLSNEEINELRDLYSTSIWKKGHRASPGDQVWHCSAMNIGNEDIVQHIQQKIKPLFVEYYPKVFSDISFNRVYGSLQSPGQVSGIHIDDLEENLPYSALLYVHSVWEALWGGATTIYDEQLDIIDSIIPYPNRLLLFPAHLYHNSAPVHSSALEDRQILIYQYSKGAKN